MRWELFLGSIAAIILGLSYAHSVQPLKAVEQRCARWEAVNTYIPGVAVRKCKEWKDGGDSE